MDYWEPAKKVRRGSLGGLEGLLNDPKFLDSLQEYDKDNIDPSIVTKVKPYITNPEFNPDKIRKASKAAHGLACWAIAIESYDRVAK
eukprot:9349501-Pyramimonas_sp.AAC.1